MIDEQELELAEELLQAAMTGIRTPELSAMVRSMPYPIEAVNAVLYDEFVDSANPDDREQYETEFVAAINQSAQMILIYTELRYFPRDM